MASGPFQQFLTSCCQAIRDESTKTDANRAQSDANRLHEASASYFGSNDVAFLEILALQNFQQLNLVFQAYKQKAGKEIEATIKTKFTGDIEQALSTLGT